jgi:hypothetical protein
MDKMFILFFVLTASFNTSFSAPSWILNTPSHKTNSTGNKIKNNSNLSEEEMMQFNSSAFYNYLSKEETMADKRKESLEFIEIEKTNKIGLDTIEEAKERELIVRAENKESNYFILAIYMFVILAVVLFTHFIYLRKYKKLIVHLRELNKENKEVTINNKNLLLLNSQLENQSETKIKQIKGLYEGSETIRNQHEKMLEYNFSLEKIIEERTKQISVLNQQLFIKNKQIEQFVYIISRKTIRPIASLKGLVYLLEFHSVNAEDNPEFVERIKACVIEMEDLLGDFNKVVIKENEALLKI